VAASFEAGAEVESIYRPLNSEDESGGYLLDKISGNSSENEALLNRMVLMEVLKGLKPQEQRIIFARYFENKTQTVIAGDLGISQVQVSRLEKRILKELREKLNA